VESERVISAANSNLHGTICWQLFTINFLKPWLRHAARLLQNCCGSFMIHNMDHLLLWFMIIVLTFRPIWRPSKMKIKRPLHFHNPLYTLPCNKWLWVLVNLPTSFLNFQSNILTTIWCPASLKYIWLAVWN